MAIFIPKKVKVGYRSRNDTFTGKLAYVNYLNDKNKWALEKSWQGWISEPKVDFYDNTAMTGFIIHRSQTRYASFSGKSVNIRIFHPNGFEFEISPDNLCSILSHSDVSHSYINQECILGWEDGRVLLLPTNSDIYLKAISDTKSKLSKFEGTFEVGSVYATKTKMKHKVIYLGKEKGCTPAIEVAPYYGGTQRFIEFSSSQEKKGHLFFNLNEREFEFKTASQIESLVDNVSMEVVVDHLAKFKHSTLYKNPLTIPYSLLEKSDETKRKFLYLFLHRFCTILAAQDELSMAEKAPIFEALEQMALKGTLIKHETPLGLVYGKRESPSSHNQWGKTKFDSAILVYTFNPVNIFIEDKNKNNTHPILTYAAENAFVDFSLEFTNDPATNSKKSMLLNNGYHKHISVPQFCYEINRFVSQFLKFIDKSYQYKNKPALTKEEKIKKVGELVQSLEVIDKEISANIHKFDLTNELSSKIVDLKDFEPFFADLAKKITTK